MALDAFEKLQTSFIGQLQQYSSGLFSCHPYSSWLLLQGATHTIDTATVNEKARCFLTAHVKGSCRPSAKQQKRNDALYKSVLHAAELVVETVESVKAFLEQLEQGADWRSTSTDRDQFKRNCLHIACHRGLSAMVLACIIYGGAQFSEFCNPRDEVMVRQYLLSDCLVSLRSGVLFLINILSLISADFSACLRRYFKPYRYYSHYLRFTCIRKYTCK